MHHQPLNPGASTLHDTDVIDGIYREKMIEAQRAHLDFFKGRMQGDA